MGLYYAPNRCEWGEESSDWNDTPYEEFRTSSNLLSPATEDKLTIQTNDLEFVSMSAVNVYFKDNDKTKIRSIMDCKEIFTKVHTLQIACTLADVDFFYEIGPMSSSTKLDLSALESLSLLASIATFELEGIFVDRVVDLKSVWYWE